MCKPGLFALYLISLFFPPFLSQEARTTIHLIGDSTMAEKSEEKRPETGWGEKLRLFFDTNVVIRNHARNGRSTRTFVEEGRWQSVVDQLKPGDYVFIQFYLRAFQHREMRRMTFRQGT